LFISGFTLKAIFRPVLAIAKQYQGNA